MAEPSSRAAWALKSVVLGTGVMTAIHFYPTIKESTMKNAVTLAQEQHAVFAREGVRRIRRQARQSDEKRRELLKYGAISVLANAVTHTDEQVNDIALEALSIFGYGAIRDSNNNQNAVRQLLNFPSIANALVDDHCLKGCQALWKVVIGNDHQQQRPSNREERVRILKQFEHANMEPLTTAATTTTTNNDAISVKGANNINDIDINSKLG